LGRNGPFWIGMVCIGLLKSAYREGHSTLSLRLFWAAFLKEACMKGLLNEFKSLKIVWSAALVSYVPYHTVPYRTRQHWSSASQALCVLHGKQARLFPPSELSVCPRHGSSSQPISSVFAAQRVPLSLCNAMLQMVRGIRKSPQSHWWFEAPSNQEIHACALCAHTRVRERYSSLVGCHTTVPSRSWDRLLRHSRSHRVTHS